MVTGLARISVATMIRRMALNEDASGSSSRTALKPMSSATISRRCAWELGPVGVVGDEGEEEEEADEVGCMSGQDDGSGTRKGFSRGPWPFALVPCPFPPTPPIQETPPVQPSSPRLVVMHLITSILFW